MLPAYKSLHRPAPRELRVVLLVLHCWLTATMKPVQVLALLVALSGTSHGRRVVLENRMATTIWVGTLGNPGKAIIHNGGWAMQPKTQVTVDVADDWAGRFWGRTGCKFDRTGKGRCETGDCANRLKCGGLSGEPPATLAEFTFKGHEGKDYYDISLVDGFNIPVTITPLNRQGGGDRYYCTTAACRANLNRSCPRRLRYVRRGKTVGCKSACLAENTDALCCRGRYGLPETCKANHPPFFKQNCPDAYSFAYDDKTSTFSCRKTGYKITFG